MEPSHWRRPAALLLLAWSLGLALFAAWGGFAPPEAEGWPYRGAAVAVGAVESGCTEHGPGDRVLWRAEAPGREPVRAFLYLPRGSCDRLALRPGVRLRARGKWRRPRPASAPGDFDERALCGPLGVARLVHGTWAVVEGPGSVLWVPYAWAEAAHRSLHRLFARTFAPEDAGTLEGLLLGYKGILPKEVLRDAQDAGVIHLLVPSGAKVALVLLGVLWLGRRFGLGPGASRAAAAVIGALYCFAVGLEPPYLRAYLAAAAAWATAARGRHIDAFQATVLSGLAILTAWPGAILTAGFQMTFAAVLAIAWAGPNRRFTALRPRSRSVARALLATAVVQAALWPFFANIFGRGSVVGGVANLLLIPSAAWLMPGGFALWASSFWPGENSLLFHGLAGALQAGLCLFRKTCHAFASLPGAAVDLSPMSAWGVLLFYAGLAAITAPPRWLAAGRLALLWTALWTAGLAHDVTRSPRATFVLIADKRHWAAIALPPEGGPIVVDAGLAPSRLERALRELSPVAPRAVVRLPSTAPGAWHGGVVVARRPGGGAEFRFGRVWLRLGEPAGTALLGRRTEGPVEFCILNVPSAVAPASCWPAGMRAVWRGGAFWITTDGELYQVASQAALDPLRRPLL